MNPDDPTRLTQEIADLLSSHAGIGSDVQVSRLALEEVSLPLHGAAEIAPVTLANEPIDIRVTPRHWGLSAAVLNFALVPDARRRPGSRQLFGFSKEGAFSRLLSQIRSSSSDVCRAAPPRHEFLINEATRVRRRTPRGPPLLVHSRSQNGVLRVLRDFLL